MKTISSKDAIERLKVSLNLSSDNALAEFLGISKATLSNWKSRNSIDIPLVFSKCEQISIDWLLSGKGEMLKEKVTESDSALRGNEADSNPLITQLLHTIKEQAEEIGQLKEQIRQLTREKEILATNARSTHVANVG